MIYVLSAYLLCSSFLCLLEASRMTNILRKRLSSSSSCVLSENVLFWSYFVMYSISRLVSMFEYRFNYIDF